MPGNRSTSPRRLHIVLDHPCWGCGTWVYQVRDRALGSGAVRETQTGELHLCPRALATRPIPEQRPRSLGLSYCPRCGWPIERWSDGGAFEVGTDAAITFARDGVQTPHRCAPIAPAPTPPADEPAEPDDEEIDPVPHGKKSRTRSGVKL